MSMKNPYEQFKNNVVFTATKEDLTLMLYEGALKFCNQAIIAIENKELPKANDLIIKVENIIREFQLTLNHDLAISKNFNLMYDYIYRQLVDANLRKDTVILAEVRDLIREFRDTWKEAMKLAKKSLSSGSVVK